LQVKTLLIPLGIGAVAATVWLSVASATPHDAVVVPPDAVLTWNTNTVSAVRASSPTKFQTDGMVYMSYVQAAVYDAVTKLEAVLPARPLDTRLATASGPRERGPFTVARLRNPRRARTHDGMTKGRSGTLVKRGVGTDRRARCAVRMDSDR